MCNEDNLEWEINQNKKVTFQAIVINIPARSFDRKGEGA